MEGTAVERIFAEALRHHQAGRLAEAERLYRQILAVDGRHADSLHSLGVIALQVGRPDVAGDLIGKAIAIEDKAALYHSNLGLVLQNQGKPEAAAARFARALDLKPDYPEAHNNLGLILQRQGKLDDAVAHFTQAVTLRPGYAEAHVNLGGALKAQGKADAAAAHYEQALAQRPDLAEAHFNLGNILHGQGKLHAAAARFERALVLDPNLAEAHSNLGNVLQDQGQGARAIDHYERAIALKPDFAHAYFNLGNVLRDQGKVEAAVARYERAVALAPDFAEAHIALGNGHLLCGRLDEAVARFRQVTTLWSAFAEGHYSLAGVLMEQGQLDQAVTHFAQAVALKPDYGEAQFSLGSALSDQGKREEAAACFERALALKRNFAEAEIALGNIRLLQGRRDEAYGLFRHAQQVQPLSRRAAAKPRADFSVLLLTAPGAVNTPSNYLVGRAGYDSSFLILLPGGEYDLAMLRASGDVVVNLISDVDQARAILPQAVDLAERLGRPVINHPRKILATGREEIAARLAGTQYCRIPKTVRIPAAAITTEALAGFEFPLLVRISGTHGGNDFEKFDGAAEAIAFIGRHPHADHYVIEYVPYKSPDGHFRKYRLIFTGGEIFPYHLAIADHWKVHHFRTDMANQEWMRKEEEAFVRDPDSVFAPAHWDALRKIQAAVSLDYFGIDCGLDGNGDIVVFEVNATMLVHDEKSIFSYKAPYIARIKQAFDAMLENAARTA